MGALAGVVWVRDALFPAALNHSPFNATFLDSAHKTVDIFFYKKSNDLHKSH